MVRLDLAVMCVGAVIFLLRVLVGLLKEWMAPAAPPRGVRVVKFYPSRKRGELIVIPLDPPKWQVPRKVAERIALLLLLAIGMAVSLRMG
jgi:hypothetical protein